MTGTASTSTKDPAEARVDRGAKVEKKKAPDPWQDAHALGAEGVVYVSGRLGPSSIEPTEEERAGLGFDLSAWYTLSREYVLGFGLTHADLGSVGTTAGIDSFEGEYGVTAAYLGARAFPWRGENAEVFLGLRVGLAWQDVDARGWRTLQPNVSQPEPFSCSGVSGPALALGAGIGGALRLGARAWLTGRLDANGYKMSGDMVEDCAVGLGSATNATLGAGLLYAFDLGEDASLSSRAVSRPQTW
jgi:hypothetical protein